MIAYDGCPACRMLVEAIGPVHGPERPPATYTGRPRETPREWAGDGPLKYWGK